MPRLRLTGADNGSQPPDVLPFPKTATRKTGLPSQADDARASEPATPDPEPEALAAINEVSRRMNDLARALGCPGYFDDEDDDRPTAA